MVLDPRRAGRHLLLLALCGAACGGDVSLRLGFVLPEGSTALSGTATVDLWATRSSTRIAFVTAVYAPGVVLALDDIDKEGPDLSLFLTARNAEGAATAYGELGPAATSSIADAGEVCCLTMCVCTDAYRQAETCDCGSTGCETCD
ncbi:MAG: hypothetical protein ACAI38_25805 [Myxococcota bacterium]